VRLPCHLRRIRGDRTLREIADQSGVNAAALSQIERGLMVPRNDQIEPLGDFTRALMDTHPDRGGDPNEVRKVLRARELIGHT
jgi:transcriptional regulator with XRE-family HTH domain